jgi:hypothetical protein
VTRLQRALLAKETKERAMRWVAWHAPRWLVYWCAIRLIAHGTSGQYGNTVVPEATAMDMLDRWDK